MPRSVRSRHEAMHANLLESLINATEVLTEANICVGAAVAKASTRAARPEWQRVAVLLDGAHKRVRPHWYSGTIVDYAAAMNEYTVRFDDGEQMSLDLRTQAALVHYTRSRMRKA